MIPVISDDSAASSVPAVSASDRAVATAELLAAVAAEQESWGGAEQLERLHRALAAAEVFVLVRSSAGSATPEVVYVDREGLRWLPTFSSAEALTAWIFSAGHQDEQISTRLISGAELMGNVLPCLPAGIGVVLDPMQPQARALPVQALITSKTGSPSAASQDAPTDGRHRRQAAPAVTESPTTEPGSELVLAAQRVHAGQSPSPEAVIDAFRAADVHFERLPGLALPVAEYEGQRWLPVFSSPARLAAFVTARDGQPQGEVPYVRMPGARLLDVYVAHAAERVGIVLDPLDAHTLVAPAA